MTIFHSWLRTGWPVHHFGGTDTMPAMPRIDYVIHYVESLRRSMTFYRNVIGLKVRLEGDGYVEFEMDNTKKTRIP